MKRAIERTKLDRETNIELVETMWEQFQNLGRYEQYVVDITDCTIEETVLIIKERIEKKSHLLLTSSLSN